MEMIFHYGDLYRQQQTNSIIQPRCFVIGQLPRPPEIQPTGTTGYGLKRIDCRMLIIRKGFLFFQSLYYNRMHLI